MHLFSVWGRGVVRWRRHRGSSGGGKQRGNVSLHSPASPVVKTSRRTHGSKKLSGRFVYTTKCVGTLPNHTVPFPPSYPASFQQKKQRPPSMMLQTKVAPLSFYTRKCIFCQALAPALLPLFPTFCLRSKSHRVFVVPPHIM